LGDFLFVNPAHRSKAGASALMSSATTDVYEPLRAGKRAFVSKEFPEARRMFLQAAEPGNAEAMAFLGKLFYEGLGGPVDHRVGTEWFRKAAERGHVMAMKNLGNIYKAEGEMQNLDEASRWAKAYEEAYRLEASLTIIDPSGQAGRGEPAIPSDATAVIIPPPRNLRIIGVTP
jgi:TPR repeat protein